MNITTYTFIPYEYTAEEEKGFRVRFDDYHYKSYDPEYCMDSVGRSLSELYPWDDNEEISWKANVTGQSIKKRRINEVTLPISLRDLNCPLKLTKTRSQDVSQRLKQRYLYTCQCCELVLQLDENRYGVETHHLHPIGEGGLDMSDNMIVACPNCHSLLDAGAVKIHPETLILTHFNRKDVPHGKKLIVKHHINHNSIEYQNSKFKG